MQKSLRLALENSILRLMEEGSGVFPAVGRNKSRIGMAAAPGPGIYIPDSMTRAGMMLEQNARKEIIKKKLVASFPDTTMPGVEKGTAL